jgi:hypothetical protein
MQLLVLARLALFCSTYGITANGLLTALTDAVRFLAEAVKKQTVFLIHRRILKVFICFCLQFHEKLQCVACKIGVCLQL